MSWLIQSEDDDSKVMVNGDNCRDGRERTDFLFIDKSDKTGAHDHGSIGSGANDSFEMHHDAGNTSATNDAPSNNDNAGNDSTASSSSDD